MVFLPSFCQSSLLSFDLVKDFKHIFVHFFLHFFDFFPDFIQVLLHLFPDFFHLFFDWVNLFLSLFTHFSGFCLDFFHLLWGFVLGNIDLFSDRFDWRGDIIVQFVNFLFHGSDLTFPFFVSTLQIIVFSSVYFVTNYMEILCFFDFVWTLLPADAANIF